MSLEGKVAFVSGASRPLGNGRAIATALAKKGADVAVSGWKHMEGALAVAEEIRGMGRKSVAVKMDVSNYPDVRKGFATIREELGPVSILVNNAALMNHNVSIAKTTVEEWDKEVKVCLNSAFYCIKEVWADMCANKWGRIINISSVAGVMGGTDRPVTEQPRQGSSVLQSRRHWKGQDSILRPTAFLSASPRRMPI
jgi:3-oxoacyl-[acyl-carrier protein] reductase